MYPFIHIVLPSYTVMAVVGGFFSVCLVYFRLDQFEVLFSSFLTMLLYCVIGGIVGSKLLFVITRIPWLINHFTARNLLMLIPESGFVFYGGLFGVLAALFFVTRKEEDLRQKVLRLTAPAIPLFHAFGRIGCFLSGCCYGKLMRNPVQVGAFELTRIPVQLIESGAELIIFAVMIAVEKKSKTTDLLRLYLILYALVRFVDEFLRGDAVRGIWGGLSTAQWISVGIIAFYLVKQIAEKNRNTGIHRKTCC